MEDRMPAEVAPGVFQLSLPLPDNPLAYVLAYYLPGPYGDTLIDTGWNWETGLRALESQVACLGRSLSSVRQVVLTHCHPDHGGLAEHLRSQYGAALIMDAREGEWAFRRHTSPGPVNEELRRWLMHNGAPAEERLPPWGEEIRLLFPGRPDIPLRGGEELKAGRWRLRVLATPGHARGHLCLYEPCQRLLFAGDHLLPEVTPNVGLEPAWEAGNPLRDYLESLRKVAELPVGQVLPAHQHTFTGAGARSREIALHHRFRTMEVISRLAPEGSTAYEAAHKVSWTVGSFARFDARNRYLAILEILAHLRLAAGEGQVEVEERRNVLYFRAARGSAPAGEGPAGLVRQGGC